MFLARWCHSTSNTLHSCPSFHRPSLFGPGFITSTDRSWRTECHHPLAPQGEALRPESNWPSGLWRWRPGAGENGWYCSPVAAPEHAEAQKSQWEGCRSSSPCSEWNWRLPGSGPASGTGPGWASPAPRRGDLDKWKQVCEQGAFL